MCQRRKNGPNTVSSVKLRLISVVFIFYLFFTLTVTGNSGSIGGGSTGGAGGAGGAGGPDLVVLQMEDLRDPNNLPAIIRTLSNIAGVQPDAFAGYVSVDLLLYTCSQKMTAYVHTNFRVTSIIRPILYQNNF